MKIAILDTGISENYAEYVHDYKDFTSGKDDLYQDIPGHGTNACRLIAQVYSQAEIYVGRVFEHSDAGDMTATVMTEAIRYAKDVWEVDLIVMLSGFQQEYRDMEKAIDEARNANILTFAAPSNYGNILPIAFPGRLYKDLKLLCMFSTNAAVLASPEFNPSALKDARYNFAILGEEITINKPG